MSELSQGISTSQKSKRTGRPAIGHPGNHEHPASEKRAPAARNASSGVVHTLPDDLRQALLADSEARAKWESLTPLARNEWICWTISVKKPETRKQHVARVCSQLKEGDRRPCCWPGCPHR